MSAIDTASATTPPGNKCPGTGLCHGCLKWCDTCGDVKHICDTRLRGERCAEHPVPMSWKILSVARAASQRMIADGKRMQREGEERLGAVVDAENARRAYDEQIEAQTRATMDAASKP